MNREVFLSILAMDAYQRGYAPGIKGVTGARIGNATIGRDSTQRPETEDGEAVGFYALSYTLDSAWAGLAEGTTVISYRGTDFDLANGGAVLDSEFIKDLWSGWSTFTGLGNNSQFTLAEAFFKSVTGDDFETGAGNVYNNLIVTGHSLGGALAGYVDARIDVSSYLVDPIPYAVTSWLNAISDAWAATMQEFLLDIEDFDGATLAGIVSINLGSTAPGTATAVGGNQIVRTGTFTRADGTTSGVADVAFDISETATRWLGDTTVSAALRTKAVNDNPLISTSRVA